MAMDDRALDEDNQPRLGSVLGRRELHVVDAGYGSGLLWQATRYGHPRACYRLPEVSCESRRCERR
jgi:hypothetical protein